MLLLKTEERELLWKRVIEQIENYIARVDEYPVAPEINVAELRSLLTEFDFNRALEPTEAIDFAVDGMQRFQVHTPHPRYFGLFNPAPTAMSITADALVAAFNPQLAAWSHNPFANEVERHLVRALAARFGYDAETADGTFCSGGAEANHTALLAALVNQFPQFDTKGLRSLQQQPVFYVSAQSHHSFIKAARFCGLGTDAVREIKTNREFQMSVNDLEAQIEIDRKNDFAPFFIVATAGTTSGGIVDDIEAIVKIAARENLWLHVDAAWGGAAVLVPELREVLAGIERADSITFDAHKWLSLPMGAGIFLTRHADILNRACRVTTEYMPQAAAGSDVIDPFTHSLQWSRRFIGLKAFLSLAVAGWGGYETTIRHQTAMGDLLRAELEKNDWKIINQTPLPVICFVDRSNDQGRSEDFLDAIAREVVASGEAWISTTKLAPDVPVLRACITNYRTDESDVISLVASLNKARESLQSK
ncbi:MAG: aminotransferase class I/II-fold pyridoxal phosphate-dependent enzyme [Acidobacteriota bacterium]|nr:aminotransferase class I/II-fold pyridoxal phosphate-dependent enzyme [Acidobacteriota bacterium]